MGYISEEEALYRSLPRATKDKIEKASSDLELLANPTKAFQAQSILINEIMKAMPGAGISGYEQAGSVLRRKFPNTFALHTFIAESHWAASKARRHNRCEFERDGFVLVADSRVAKKNVKQVYEGLRELGIAATWNKPALRSDMFDHIKTFSNMFVADPAIFGGQEGIDLLLPHRITPKYKDANPDELEAWQYQFNGREWTLPLNMVDHVRSYSLSKEFLGTPMLSSVVVDIEADLHASTWTNTMWQKGGLIKALVSMENPNIDTGINQNGIISFAMQMQELFARTMAGAKGGGNLMFVPPVKGVHNVVNPKDLEGPYKETSERTAIKVCELLGCPPEVIGLSRSSQYVNAAATLDFASLSVDNDNYYVASLVDFYISERIIQRKLKANGIYIQQKGEFGAISKICAEFGKIVAEMGADVMTVNEFRVKVLHWNPLEDARGDMYIGHFINEVNMLKAAKPETSAKERKELLETMFGPAYTSTIKGREVEFIKYDPQDIKHWQE